jgi:hypothetical protein
LAVGGRQNDGFSSAVAERTVRQFYTTTADITPTVIITDGRRGSHRPADKPYIDIICDDYGYSFKFFTPLRHSYSNENDFSPIKKFRYQGFSFMFSGDACQVAEREFVERYSGQYDFNANVIRIGHHGSRTSSSLDYLTLVSGNTQRNNIYAVINAGLGNSYGHPHSQVLERFEELGFDSEKILRTDLESGLTNDNVFAVQRNADGVYELLVNGELSRPGADTPTFFQRFLTWWNALEMWQMIVIVVVVIIVIIIASIIIYKILKKKAESGGAKGKQKNSKSKPKSKPKKR